MSKGSHHVLSREPSVYNSWQVTVLVLLIKCIRKHYVSTVRNHYKHNILHHDCTYNTWTSLKLLILFVDYGLISQQIHWNFQIFPANTPTKANKLHTKAVIYMLNETQMNPPSSSSFFHSPSSYFNLIPLFVDQGFTDILSPFGDCV